MWATWNRACYNNSKLRKKRRPMLHRSNAERTVVERHDQTSWASKAQRSWSRHSPPMRR